MNNLDKIMMVIKVCNKEELCIGDDPLSGKGNSIHFCVYLFRHIEGLLQHLYLLTMLTTVHFIMLWALYVYKIQVNIFNFELILEFYNS